MLTPFSSACKLGITIFQVVYSITMTSSLLSLFSISSNVHLLFQIFLGDHTINTLNYSKLGFKNSL